MTSTHKKPMNKSTIALLAGALLFVGGCQDYLNVNTNPNAPAATDVTPNLLLAPMIHWMVTSPQYDARFVGR
jgi:PBP1b-binding outer membrane lipoprotein LpoB